MTRAQEDARAQYSEDPIDPLVRFDNVETTISHLFRFPHPALGGRTYGEALADGLAARGLLPSDAPLCEVGGGLGSVGAEIAGRAGLPWISLDLSPRLLLAQRLHAARAKRRWSGARADALRLPLRTRSVRGLLLANEVAADLPPREGPLALVREAARALAPGGALCLTEFGGDGPPVPVALGRGKGAHTEHTVCFPELLAEARAQGLEAEVVPLVQLVPFDLAMRAASCDDVRRLRWLARGLPMAAWPPEELRRRHPRLTRIFALEYPPIGSPRFPEPRATGGLAQVFFALLAKRAA